MTNNIFSEIQLERLAQDQQWGGPDHDDRHSARDWSHFIGYQLLKIHVHCLDPRPVFIKIAALCIAAVESMDRNA